MNPLVHFVHISDTHISTEASYDLLGVNTFTASVKLVEALNKLPVQPDFIIHTGDVASVNGEPEAYTLAEKIFKKLKAPIYYASGNHDISENLIRTLKMSVRHSLSDTPDFSNSYFFNLGGIDFITLDGRGPREIDPHGIVTPGQITELEKKLSKNNNPTVIFIHFPLLPLESTWLDRDMLLINGLDIHKLLVRFKNKIRGVFSGHVHRGIMKYHEGIFYSSVGSTFCQFDAMPGQEQVSFDRQPVGFYNFITVSESGVLIKEHTFPL